MRMTLYENNIIHSESYSQKKGVNADVLQNAYLLPWKGCFTDRCGGGIVSEDGEFQMSSAWHEGFTSGYDFCENEVVYREESVIYIGCLYHIWGHAITDNLKKIWYLGKTDISKKLVYITVENKPLPSYVYEIFSLAGVDLKRAEHITSITQFREIVNPDNSLVNVNENRFYTDEFEQIINRILMKIPDAHIEKVYFTRTHLKQNKDIGEKSIENLFRWIGYQIIAPEEYSVKNQLTILKNCKTFVATEGSISHSSVFCRPGTKVVLLKKIDYVNPYTEFINEMKCLNATFVNVHHSSLACKERPWIGPFYLYITKELSMHFGWYGLHVPYYFLLSWYEYRWKLCSKLKKHIYKLRGRLILKQG